LVGTTTRVGTEVAGYRLEQVLGHGGMSVVYLAEHIRLGRKVALKLLAPALSEDDSYRERFVRESRRAAELEHPNIIPIYDAGEDDGQLYIAMRYVEGSDLKSIIKRDGPMPLGRVIFILEQIAGALEAAHERDLVHRDVKPSNILVSTPSDRVYLTDFGVVKHTASRGLTKTGFFIGTVDYAPPEQIEGLPLDPRTDIYALGCVLYECLTARPPFDREGEVAVMHAHLTEPPPRLTKARPDLPKSLNEVVATAMAKSKEDRYATCDDFITAARDAALQRLTTTRRELDPAEIVAAAPAAAEEPVAAMTTDEALDGQARVDESAVAAAPTPSVVAASPAPEIPPAPPPTATGTALSPPGAVQPPPPARRRPARWLVTALLVAIAAAASGISVYFATKSDSNKAGTSPPVTTPTAKPQATLKGLAGVVLPPVWKNCAVENSPQPGAVQTAVCLPPPGSTVAFPDQLTLSLYPSTKAALAAYAALKESDPRSAGIKPGTGRCDGSAWRGDGEWLHGDGAKGGHRFCFFDANENAVIVWTHERSPGGETPQPNHLDLLAIARFGGKNNTSLASWWNFWHPRIGKCPLQGCVAQLP
jgi:serine/threonine protein kinase